MLRNDMMILLNIVQIRKNLFPDGIRFPYECSVTLNVRCIYELDEANTITDIGETIICITWNCYIA